MTSDRRVTIMGGGGHVGLPLGLVMAESGYDVTLYDTNEETVSQISSGHMPFQEEGGAELLHQTLGKSLRAVSDPGAISMSDAVICVVGTPVDRFMNPEVNALVREVHDVREHLRSEQLFVLRSTVAPGTTEHLGRRLREWVPGIGLAYCPERVAQGFSIREIRELPQFISGIDAASHERAWALFAPVCRERIALSPREAEFAKLMCNAYRYMSFAISNQFYDLCLGQDLDYYRLWSAVKKNYPRMEGLHPAGFAAGPCLVKDTMQLIAFRNDEVAMAQSAFHVNEGLPFKLVRQLKRRFDLSTMTAGILGMAFKGNSDDTRESLSHKLRKLLQVECREVLCTDPYAQTEDLCPLERVLKEADVLVVGAPHDVYKDIRPGCPVIDPWNVLGLGGLLVEPKSL